MTVVLVTTSYDASADYVIRALQSKGASFFRLDTDKFPREVAANYRPGDGFCIEADGRRVRSREVSAVWFRRHAKPDLPRSLGRGLREFCEREADAFLLGALTTLRTKRWLSSPAALAGAERKPYQLHMARIVGLRIPPTVITSDPSTAADFTRSTSVIAKAVGSGYIAARDGNRAIFTSRVRGADLQDLESLRLAPVTFQEFVDKRSDIRVTIVGDQVFAAEIMSQEHESSKVDWRATDYPDLEHRPHQLPAEVASRCLALVKRLGLAYGAIDLALTEGGGYIFFEINPNGEWAWIEDQLGYPISDAIADWLLA